MAHFILEYSDNLKNEALDLDLLFENLISEAVNTGIFPLAGIRCRAHNCEYYRIADGTENFGFVHLNVRIGTGRNEEEKTKAAAVLFTVLSEHLSTIYDSQGLALSFELTELPTHKFNQNNLRHYMSVS